MDVTPAAGPVDGPTPVDGPRLRRLLGDPELAWLVDRARRRLAREQPLTGSVFLRTPTPAQRTSVERLLGRSPGSGRSLTVRLDEVDAVLRRSGVSPDGLASAVVALTGPVVLLGPARAAENRAWQEAYAPLDALAAELPALTAWVERLRAEGLVRRLAGTPAAAQALLSRVAVALGALPAGAPVSLPTFSARLLGGAHALDDGTPLATITLAGVRALTGFPDGTGAAWRRDAWASAGLLRDELSSTVLTLNLRGTPALDWMADAGEPSVLTLRQLIRRSPNVSAPAVRICENPAVLAAAADTHGAHSAPLVCLQGQPSAAALALLRHLHEGGATLLYHGDFDWGGLRIASALLRRVPWRPWRYTAADYRAAALTAPDGPPLAGQRAEAPWDPDLPQALMESGVRVEEESVLDLLLSDLE
ncbi:TIGR02679 family protein [Streptomyces jumonjinensis]|uniref:TIGR02679 family protein n=1 Tax=Streptomyces jumonjinensis TaxID=1945 RepID=A0A646KDU3_STRJU|nr:TIGR02679 family protein [Streptomyces jumonjinensis]MQS99165.1 TIGR02679 family protein [Streptomyces jumonjinensis]